MLGAGLVGLGGATLLGCSAPATEGSSILAPVAPSEATPTESRVDVPSTPTPPAGPPPPLPAGRERRQLLADTLWQTPLVATHSGREGPRVLVLGGVHGNEPGGWLAAESVADWEPAAGSLLVIPRANVVATRIFERTLPDLGDLNRSYPGAADGLLPMSRMASAIIDVVREFQVDLVLDMHESWGFYLERGANSGTAFIGQTVTKGDGPLTEVFVRDAVEAVNTRITAREELTFRGRLPQPAPNATPPPGLGGTQPGGRSTSSLSIGTHVPGTTAILVEMGQMEQPEYRRRDLHLLLATELLTRHGVL
ncbi:MAG: succinylglutamate desuccinylase/aspartoacylase family protein [Dehalococcoidia bacterium]|nr:succinylglutamate desuccinylase/aspartoacylase family protein [Dehalococcoidia bacterium]